MSRDAIHAVLAEAVHCLLDTVTTAIRVFDRRKRSHNNESLIEEMIRLVQVGEPAAAPAPQALAGRTSHQRRASRLASISLPFPKVELSGHGSPISMRQILRLLPSSEMLLRHLPTSITAFTPFIAPSSPPLLSDKLFAWRSSSTSSLRDALPSWLVRLQSVTDIWFVRKSIGSLLANGEFEGDIQKALEADWGARVTDVWSDKLEKLVESAETEVRQAGEQIRGSGAEMGRLDFWSSRVLMSLRYKLHTLHIL